MTHYYWLVICVIMYANIFSTKACFNYWAVTKN